ncbi:MAG TPA: tripartite tricarboxylate transporter substrate binding protein, partial [Afifellaceae bacterium]|nr:tripartite tricarboxylate transporter substrate binding protein [Afifellaceae bacterium]
MPFITRAILAGLCLGLGVPAIAQSYPSKPIRMVVPSAPGSGPELMARLVAQELAKTLGRPVVIDPRPGAGGSL